MTPRSPSLPRPTTLEESIQYYKDLFDQCYTKGWNTFNLYNSKRQEITANYPKWKAGRMREPCDRVDARVSIFTKQVNILITTSFHFRLYSSKFCNLEWLQANIPSDFSSHLDVMDRQFDKFFKFAISQFFYTTFHSMESVFRIFVKEIHPNGEVLSTGKFQNVYSTLFKKLNIQRHAERINLLVFMSAIRNTIHNDWKYVPPKQVSSTEESERPREFVYKNQTYTFVPHEFVNFITFEMVINFANDLLEIFDEIVNHPSIVEIPEIISEWISLEE